MSGTVKKVFMTLVTIVACVIIGALVLNTLLPNVATSMVDATENMLYKATGISMDWNGNGKFGSDSVTDNKFTPGVTQSAAPAAGVDGFK